MRFALAIWLIAVFCPAGAVAESAPIRIGITPAIVHDEYALMMDLRQYLERKTGRVVELVSRNSYRETIDLLKQDRLDFAWVSAYPYVYLHHNLQFRLLAAPVLHGRPYSRAYLIVPASDRTTTSLLHLKERFFAYADPYSCTGYLVPRYELRQAGKDAARFFAKTFFTWGHKTAIQAVASGLADGAYVDSFVWDSLAAMEPELTTRTRVVARSAECGASPLVAGRKVGAHDFNVLRGVLFGMAADPEGATLLQRFNIDGFVPGDPKFYAETARIMRAMGEL